MKLLKEMTDFEKSVYVKSKRLKKSLEHFHSTGSYDSLQRLQNSIKNALLYDNYKKAFELENEFEANTETPIETLW